MKLKEITPMLTTENLKETLNFYTDILGFECDAYDENYGWASVKRDNVAIMFGLPNAHIPYNGPNFTGSLYMYTDDVDSIWEKVKDSVSICYPLEVFDYGMKEFGIYDNNGYLLKYGQADQ